MKTAPPDSRTKDKLLDAAEQLMLAQGYTATSVDEICQAAGLTKGSFFHYFDGKEQLGQEVAARFYAARKEHFEAAAFHRRTDPLDRVFGRVDYYLEMTRRPESRQGCLLGMFAQELSGSHPKIRAVCATCFADSAESFQHDLQAAKAKHAPRARWNPNSLAEHMTAILQGAIILAKAKQDPDVMVESLRHFREYLKCLFGK